MAGPRLADHPRALPPVEYPPLDVPRRVESDRPLGPHRVLAEEFKLDIPPRLRDRRRCCRCHLLPILCPGAAVRPRP